MRCSSCEPLLDRYVEGTLAPQQMRRVGEHVNTCKACASLVTELRVVDALLATTASVELAPNFTFALMAEVRTMPVPRSRALSVWALLTFYLIAAWVVTGASFAFFSHRLSALGAATANARVAFAHGASALSGAAHAFGPATPAVVGIVSGVLALDVMLIAAIILFHQTIRPRLSARLARSEAS